MVTLEEPKGLPRPKAPEPDSGTESEKPSEPESKEEEQPDWDLPEPGTEEQHEPDGASREAGAEGTDFLRVGKFRNRQPQRGAGALAIGLPRDSLPSVGCLAQADLIDLSIQVFD